MAIEKEQQLDLAFHALADPTRRAIVHMLCESKEISATMLAANFSSAQPTISKHLKVLEKAEIVARRIDGRNHYFSAQTEVISIISDWAERHQSLWNNSFDQLGKFLDTADK